MPRQRIRYTSRTAQQIREDLLRAIPKLAPSWTSHGEDEPGMALVEMLAGVADGLHYYFDKQALETFLPSVVMRKNALSLSHLIGYRPRRTLGASGTLTLYTTSPLPHDVFIPAGAEMTTAGGVAVVTEQSVYLPPEFSGFRTLRAVQGTRKVFVSESTGGDLARVLLPHNDPSEQLFQVTTYGEHWVEFRDSQPEDPDNRWYHYHEDLDGNVYLEFRLDLGNVPMIGTPIRVEYLLSQDIKIPAVTPLNAPVIEPPDDLPEAHLEDFEEAVSRLRFETGTLYGYRPCESVKTLRSTAPVSIKTKQRAVAENDYRHLARRFGGVKDLKVLPSDFYTRQVVAYVLMEEEEDPTQGLLDDLHEYLNNRNDLTLDLVTEAAVLQPFHCEIEVNPASGYSEAIAVFEAREALLRFFRTTAHNFGRTIRISEVYNRANQPDSVSYVNLVSLYWDGEEAAVNNLEPDSEVHVPVIGDRLITVPVVE